MKTTSCLSRVVAVLLAALALPAYAVDHHVTTAQQFQNALTLAATNGADDAIFLAAGYYTGNFSYNSAEAHAVTVQAEPGVARSEVVLDGANVGGALNLNSAAAANFTVRGLTVMRKCGADNVGTPIVGASGHSTDGKETHTCAQ